MSQVVVNFDPDTRVHAVTNTYFRGTTRFTRVINFTDANPDTVSYQSWLRFDYSGWDDTRDTRTCPPASVNPDRCIEFQFQYERRSARVAQFPVKSQWLPTDAPFHNTDLLSATDSNSANVGSLEYEFRVRSRDENGTPDGTPAIVKIVGNFDPTMTAFQIVDGKGVPVNGSASPLDTLTWNWWRPENNDTIDISDPTNPRRKKVFSWRVTANGRDHPLDPMGSGVQSWQYLIYTDYGKSNQAVADGPLRGNLGKRGGGEPAG